MANLTSSQIWALASFVAALAFFAVTVFLSGDVQTFGFMAVTFTFAAFAVLMSNRGKDKREME